MKFLKITLTTLTTLLTILNHVNAQNTATIEPEDTAYDIIRKAANVTPTPRQLRWQQLELTAFFHFGVNTYTGKEWGTGKENPKIFNPTNLDTEQWIRTVKEAGIKQVILTAKHHDGFCLWPTATTEHSLKNSPWKNGKGDVVKEVAEACKKYDIGFGIYLSPWDMNASIYGTPEYNDFFLEQLTELLTKYGQIDEVWFDGANGEGPNGKKQVYDFNRWYTHIRKLQPQAVIAIMGPDVRWVGTETGYGRETEWSVLPTAEKDEEKIALLSQKDVAVVPTLSGSFRDQDRGSRSKLKGATGLIWYPAEMDVSIRPGWFYRETENDKIKTPEILLDIYFGSVGRNGVLLLNIPPDKRGLIHENDIKVLQEWKRLRDEIFDDNLVKKAKLKGNGEKLKAVKDDNYNTFWTTKGNDSTAVIDLSFKTPQTMNVFELQENIAIGQRIEKFIVEYKDGEEWKKAIEGTTVGYKRLIQFPEITTSFIRLKIVSSRLSPTLSKIGLYKQ
ncbi:alpha-L-fucosidase [Pedobacter glucosidilyticus]|uniref:alpha-L-fucosidase n=1 Tax=Pedobacter glucosidilyticus TaxID=1122941 RepID=UPI00047885FC|nr:alpha-L-fucosidase [Pedobacter glucosidilyticus]